MNKCTLIINAESRFSYGATHVFMNSQISPSMVKESPSRISSKNRFANECHLLDTIKYRTSFYTVMQQHVGNKTHVFDTKDESSRLILQLDIISILVVSEPDLVPK